MSLTCFAVGNGTSVGNHQSYLLLLPAHADRSYPLHLKGKVRVRVLAPEDAVLQCLGCSVPVAEEDAEIFSPRGFSLLGIRARIVGREKQLPGKGGKNLTQKLDLLQLEKEVKNEVLVKMKNKNLVCLLLSKLEVAWCDRLERYMGHFGNLSLFGRDVSATTNLTTSPAISPDLERVLGINLFAAAATGLRFFEEKDSWEDVVRNVISCAKKRESPRILAMGGKGVGKSSFLKYLANRLLTETCQPVLYIDLDPGQAEFTVPGCISVCLVEKAILSPNFCHLNQKKRMSIFVGDVNMSNCKERYPTCLRQLARFCESTLEFSTLPWLINSMGFSKGLGLMFMQQIIDAFRPSKLVSIRSRFPTKNYPDGFEKRLMSQRNGKIYNFEAVPESKTVANMGATDLWGHPEPRKLRDIVLLSHFSRMSSDVKPNQIQWTDIVIQVLHDGCPEMDFLQLLNGSLVSLGSAPADAEQAVECKYGLRTVSSTVIAESLDFAIVMAIDCVEKTFTILSSLSLSELRAVNCLSVGAVRLPASLVCEHPAEERPYVSCRTTDNPLSESWQRSGKPKANLQ